MSDESEEFIAAEELKAQFPCRAYCSYCDKLVPETEIRGSKHILCGWHLSFMPPATKDTR